MKSGRDWTRGEKPLQEILLRAPDGGLNEVVGRREVDLDIIRRQTWRPCWLTKT